MNGVPVLAGRARCPECAYIGGLSDFLGLAAPRRSGSWWVSLGVPALATAALTVALNTMPKDIGWPLFWIGIAINVLTPVIVGLVHRVDTAMSVPPTAFKGFGFVALSWIVTGIFCLWLGFMAVVSLVWPNC